MARGVHKRMVEEESRGRGDERGVTGEEDR